MPVTIPAEPTTTSCDPSDLVEAGKCINQCIPAGMQMAVLISIWCRIVQLIDDTMSCDPADLMESAKCIYCNIPPGMQMPVLISLSCQILTGGGTGGGCGSTFSGDGDPTGVVFPDCDTAFYVQKDSVPTGIIWSWYDGVWH